MPGERIMKLAEELYQAGFISYPRTETDAFDPAMDLRVCGCVAAGQPTRGVAAHALLTPRCH
jgi:DNA topoisomerase-3